MANLELTRVTGTVSDRRHYGSNGVLKILMAWLFENGDGTLDIRARKKTRNGRPPRQRGVLVRLTKLKKRKGVIAATVRITRSR